MSRTDGVAERRAEAGIHEICVEGHLDDRWADWVDGLAINRAADGTTKLTGRIADQAALHGVLNRVRDLGVPVISVRRLPSGDEDETTMMAIVQNRYGSADTLEVARVERPTIGDRDVLVRVHAASIGAGDWHRMTGEPYLLRLFAGLRGPRNGPGMCLAGRVEATGKLVTRFREGDQVFGVASGAFAEYASVPEDKLVPKPANLTFEQAASTPDSAASISAVAPVLETALTGAPAVISGRAIAKVARIGLRP